MEPEQLLVDVDDPPVATQGGMSSRAMLNVVSLGVVILLVGVAARWWVAPAQTAWARLFPPAPYTGPDVYVYNQGNALDALRLSDGGAQWQLPTDSPDLVAQVNGRLIIGSVYSGHISGVNAHTGQRVWQVQFPATIVVHGFAGFIGATDSANWSEDTGWLQIGSPSNATEQTTTIYAFSLQTGRILWQTTYQAANNSYPFMYDHTLFITRVDQGTTHLIAYDTRSKKPRWNVPLAPATAGVSCRPATAGVACEWGTDASAPTFTEVSYADGHVVAQFPATGDIAALSGDALYTVDNAANPNAAYVTLRAYDIASGALRWQNAFAGRSYPILTAPLVPDHLPGGVFIVQAIDSSQSYLGVDSATGATRWIWQPPAASHVGPNGANWNVTTDSMGRVFIGVGDDVYALDAGMGQVRWHTLATPKSLPGIAGAANLQSCFYQHATLFCNGDRALFALDATTGRVRWQLSQDVLYLTTDA